MPRVRNDVNRERQLVDRSRGLIGHSAGQAVGASRGTAVYPLRV
jgi:hypothetical protein